MTRSRSSNNLTERKPSALVRSSPQAQDASLSRQLSESLLGVKGSMLRQKNSPPPEVKEENPLARLKLLLVRHCCNYFILLTLMSDRIDRIFPDPAHSELRNDAYARNYLQIPDSDLDRLCSTRDLGVT
jgi:hypothetical protein